MNKRDATTILELKPQYSIELIECRRAHFYKVIDKNTVYKFPGVTGFLSVIGGEKTQRLIKWAKKVSLEQVRQELLAYGTTSVLLEPDFVQKLIKQAKKRPKDILEDAADRGKIYHAFLNSWLSEESFECPSDLEPILTQLETRLDSLNIDLIKGETPVASLEHKFGGTLDAIGIKNNEYGIVDWKFSGDIYPEYLFQCGAYAQGLLETYKIQPKWISVFRYDLEEKFWQIFSTWNIDYCWSGFKTVMTLKNIMSKSPI